MLDQEEAYKLEDRLKDSLKGLFLRHYLPDVQGYYLLELVCNLPIVNSGLDLATLPRKRLKLIWILRGLLPIYNSQYTLLPLGCRYGSTGLSCQYSKGGSSIALYSEEIVGTIVYIPLDVGVALEVAKGQYVHIIILVTYIALYGGKE